MPSTSTVTVHSRSWASSQACPPARRASRRRNVPRMTEGPSRRALPLLHRLSAEPSGSTAWLNETGLISEHHRLDSVAQPQLGEDVGDVRPHRCLAEEEAGGDLCVRETVCDEP